MRHRAAVLPGQSTIVGKHKGWQRCLAAPAHLHQHKLATSYNIFILQNRTVTSRGGSRRGLTQRRGPRTAVPLGDERAPLMRPRPLRVTS
ncbi:hypothetical protein E2C01_063094 [Portunus trituberculatus]|uniref:Uncharacterized protein n=1 Tax=Portunus trituberculatus TaxID=210409 RepID=A0A5B7HJW4_PORTR|nr:hypothetical protein [Portunus trituberculatus]